MVTPLLIPQNNLNRRQQISLNHMPLMMLHYSRSSIVGDDIFAAARRDVEEPDEQDWYNLAEMMLAMKRGYNIPA